MKRPRRLQRLCWYHECGRGFWITTRQARRRYCSPECARLAENYQRRRVAARKRAEVLA